MSTVKELGHEYWEWMLRTDPFFATYIGDFRYNDKMPQIGEMARKQQLQELQSMHDRAAALNNAGLNTQDSISLDILRIALHNQIEERVLGFHEWAVDQLMGPQVSFLEVPSYHPARNDQDFEDLATRWRMLPSFMDDYLDNLRAGVREGRTAPTVAVERVLGQLDGMLAKPVEESPLLPKEHVNASAETWDELLNCVREQAYPAFAKLRDYLRAGYPARSDVGVWATPGGDEAYRFRIRRHTSTELSAQEIHDIGNQMLRDVEAEMLAIAKRSGHDGDVASFMQKLQNDASQFHDTREELLDGYRAILAEAQAMLPKWFGMLPKAECIVKPIEEFREKDAPAAYYYQPPDDFSRPGVFYANTYEPGKRSPRYNMVALALHEAVPGHHLQVVLAMEQKDLPDFRRYSDFTAYIEGWALYTERLGVEMGAYHDDLSHFGMLTYQAWRICRLIVDTGMHALRWTRDDAIHFMQTHVGLPQHEVVNEIDRYIIWPGQALAYAMGMREIMRLRALAEEQLGSDFDIRMFHDEVLRWGAVPLSTLHAIVSAYVDRLRAAHTL